MIAVLHRHRGNVQLLLNARADPWQAVPIVSLCDHPWYWFGFLSRRESVNVVQVSVAQGPVDTVADLLTQSRDTMDHQNSRMVLALTARPYCHDRTCYPPLGQYNPEVPAQYRATSYARWLCFAPMATNIGRPNFICRCELGGNFSNRLV